AAEAEGIDAVARSIGPAQINVGLDDVALQSDAEDAAEEGERLEGRGADPVMVVRNLAERAPRALGLRRLFQVERLVQAPDIRLEEFGRTVSGAVGEDNDRLRRLWHAPPPGAAAAIACNTR